MRRITLTMLLLVAAALTVGAPGCQDWGTHALMGPATARGTAGGLSAPQADLDVQAMCTPPLGWKREPLKLDGDHAHQVWLSPSGRTAYGVIHFPMPLPVSADFVYPFFMDAMKKTEGEAIQISKRKDPALPGIRLVAEGGLYRIRTNLMVRGWQGWGVYAGTLRNQPVDPDELDLAERAREHTRVGLPEGAAKVPDGSGEALADTAADTGKVHRW